GDAAVWRWFRYTSVAPNALVCALMALERWLGLCAAGEVDMKQLFLSILGRTHSAAILGVLSTIALKYPHACAQGVLPILCCPAFWLMDQERLTRDQVEAQTRGGVAQMLESL